MTNGDWISLVVASREVIYPLLGGGLEYRSGTGLRRDFGSS
jgi:hypothetical protein